MVNGHISPQIIQIFNIDSRLHFLEILYEGQISDKLRKCIYKMYTIKTFSRIFLFFWKNIFFPDEVQIGSILCYFFWCISYFLFIFPSFVCFLEIYSMDLKQYSSFPAKFKKIPLKNNMWLPFFLILGRKSFLSFVAIFIAKWFFVTLYWFSCAQKFFNQKNQWNKCLKFREKMFVHLYFQSRKLLTIMI